MCSGEVFLKGGGGVYTLGDGGFGFYFIFLGKYIIKSSG